MPIRNAKPLKWVPRGVSDALDATNAFQGAMASLANLIPSPGTMGVMVCRPACAKITAMTGSGAATPGVLNLLMSIGNIAYGMVPAGSGTYNGKDVPFAYNVTTGAFLTITGIVAANLPTSPVTTGDWTPPTMAVIGSRIVVTHPGFSGTTNVIGWFDISGFSSNTVTGTTHSNATLDTLSTNVLTAGWKPGMTISSSANDIPANTTIISIASNGLSLVLSNAATGSNAGDTLTVTGGTATSPQWATGQTNINTLKAVPVAVFNFNGRAYYAVPGNGTQFSDSGNPTNITNASQALVPNNGIDISAFGGLPYTQTTGGTLQALIAFQGDAEMQQITGDAATSNLTINSVGVGVGTLAPNTICQTTIGLAFVAPDGLRYIDFLGTVHDPIGARGQGVLNPFVFAINPSRMTAAFNQNVMRISVKNGAANNQPVQEWWYDFSLKIFTGPHTSAAAVIDAYQAATGVSTGHGFLLALSGVSNALFSSDVNPSTSSIYTENGTALSWVYQTSLLPDTGALTENQMAIANLAAAITELKTLTIVAQDENATVLDQVSLMGPTTGATIWDSFVWGAAPWLGGTSPFYQHPLPWDQPIVFKQMSIQVNGTSDGTMAIGNLYMLYQELGYVTQAMG